MVKPYRLPAETSRLISGRFTYKPPLPWLAVTTSFGTLVIALLVGYIFNATVNRIARVEDDYRQMMELKKRAELADIAKSQACSCPCELNPFSLSGALRISLA